MEVAFGVAGSTGSTICVLHLVGKTANHSWSTLVNFGWMIVLVVLDRSRCGNSAMQQTTPSLQGKVDRACTHYPPVLRGNENGVLKGKLFESTEGSPATFDGLEVGCHLLRSVRPAACFRRWPCFWMAW